MLDIPNITYTVLTMAITLVIAIANRHFLTRTHKILSVQVLLALSVEISAYLIAVYEKANTFFLNWYIIADYAIMLYAWSSIHSKIKNRMLLPVLFILYLVIWGTQINTGSIHKFANIAYLYGCATLLLLFLYTLVAILTNMIQTDENQQIITISLAIIIFYCGQIPLFGFINILPERYPSIARQAFNINIVLEVLRYGLIGYVFYCSRKQRHKT